MQSFRRKWHIDKSFLPVSKAEPTQSRTATIPEQQKPQKHRLETKVGTSGLTYGTGVQSVGSLAGDTGEFLHYQEQRRRLLICICTCTHMYVYTNVSMHMHMQTTLSSPLFFFFFFGFLKQGFSV